MYLLFGLSTLVLLGGIFDETSACGGRRRRPPPPPCHWETCHARYGSWTGANPADGQCVTQRLPCHHHKQRHQRHGGCPGSTHCHQRDQHRTWCKCMHYRITGWGEWKQMPGQENKNPKKFERVAHYAFLKYSYGGNCNGIRGPKNPEKQHDMFHDCKHFTETQWGGWEVLPGQENKECRTSVRKMNYQNSATTVEKKCHPHVHGPHNPRTESQEKCYPCKSMKYTNGDWTTWRPTGKQVGNCMEMKRFRQHEVTQVMVEKVNGQCPEMPLPEPLVETREDCL